MPNFIVAPNRKGTYAVLKDFRFCGRSFEADMEFNARRLDVPRGRLDGLYRDGFIGLMDEDEDAAERETQQAAIDGYMPPQPIVKAVDDSEETLDDSEDDVDMDDEEDDA